MKTNKIRWIIGVSIISLLCLLVFQLLWLKQTEATNKLLLNQSIKRALNNTVALLEKKVVYGVMHKKSDYHSSTKNVDVRIKTLDILDDSNDIENNIDSLINSNTKQNRVITKKSEVIIISGDSSANKPLKRRIDSIVGEIINDIKVDNSKTIKNLTAKQIEDVLNQELKKENINTTFEFAITNEKGEYAVKSKNYDSLEEYQIYFINFFHLSVANKRSKLEVKLAGVDSYLQKSLIPLVLIIIVLTAIIGIVYYIAIKTILNQKKLNTIKNDFINNMTHEFKTPIATISLAADALKNQPTTKEQNHFTDIIKQESQSMNQKVETILQMALVEQQKILLNKERIGINQVVKNALQHLKLKLDSSLANVSATYLENDSIIEADAHHMGNVVANIIDNAIKYASGTPDITVNLKQLNDKVLISVEDKGIGMTKEEQKRVFDKFYRAQSGNIHNTKGFGLGLSYASEIINLHDGEISLESEKESGTTVTITIPIYNGNEA